MKIGFDIDGVLANFVAAYQPLFVKTTGRNDFLINDITAPPCWDWPTLRGYTEKETKAVWDIIKRDDTFWMNLPAFEDSVLSLKSVLKVLELQHEVYYLTDRAGIDVKRQTKFWLIDKLNYIGRAHTEPTVLITATGEKGHVARALKLDAYIDDKPSNVEDVVRESPNTRMYYLNKRYNQDFPVVGARRIGGLANMLDAEISSGNL